jgi:replication factor C large subunit
MIPLTVKYTPQTLQDVLGQDYAVKTIKDFVINFEQKKKKALLLYGPPGAGKTSTTYAIGKQSNLEIVEVNASDLRNEKKLRATIGQASTQRSLFGKSKLLLIDEVDGVVGRKDRGAVPTLKKLIKNTAYPIILTANNPWNKKFSPLRSACTLIEFKAPSNAAVVDVLKKVCAKEGITFEEKAITALARRSGGDIRGALVDLQTLTTKKSFTLAHLDVLGDRRQTETMFQALLKILKTTNADIARTAFDTVNENFDEIMLWVDENLPKEYTKPDDIYRAYERISRADIFRGRIMRRQHWRFLAIITVLLSAGVAVSKDTKYNQFVKYAPTQRLLSIWRAKMRNAQRFAIAEKISARTHCSTKAAREHTLPYVQAMVQSNRLNSAPLINFFDLSSEEVKWLCGN